MPIFDFECQNCGIVEEKIVVRADQVLTCSKCGSILQRKFPNKMSFKLNNAKHSMCGWSYDGYTSRVPTHEVFNRDGTYKEKYQKKHLAGGTPIFDNVKGV